MVPIVKSLPSHIKDTNHALKIFRDFTFSGKNKFIFTMDITSLYTVIPNNEGLSALKFYFDQRSTKEPSSETLLRLAELVLTLNCFSFSNNHYQQIMVSPWALKWDPAMPISSWVTLKTNFSTNTTDLNLNYIVATSMTASAQLHPPGKNLNNSFILSIRSTQH